MPILLILGALGIYLYKTRSNQEPTGFDETVAVGGQPTSQPSQLNPIRYMYDPRVDTENQPWYGGSEAWQNLDQSVNTVTEGTSDLWSSLENVDTNKLEDPYQIQIVPDSTKEMYAMPSTEIMGTV